MPRGLGDSPLKKEKRARRVGARGDAASATGPESPSDVSTDVVGPETMHASSSSSRSYNDVFFQRRPENSGAAANSASEEIHVDDLGTTAPIAAAEVVSVSVLPEAAASASMDATAVDAIAVGPAPSVVTVAAPVTQVEAAPEQVKPSPVNNIAQPQASVETGSHEETKTGFFSRIFGRLHK